MEPIGTLLGLGVVALVLLVVLRPLVSGSAGRRETTRGSGERSALARQMDVYASLLEQRNAVYAAIKELDFEHETAKVSDEEHARQRLELVRQGVAILKQLDALEAKTKADDPLEADIAAMRQSDSSAQIASVTGTDIEDQIAALRGTTATNGYLTCPVCNTRVGPDDRFCGHCGQELASSFLCPECNTLRQPTDSICAHCGAALPTLG